MPRLDFTDAEAAGGDAGARAVDVDTLRLVAELRLDEDDARKAVAGRRMVISMARVGERTAAQRDKDARATRRT
jgi:hypothetical protein